MSDTNIPGDPRELEALAAQLNRAGETVQTVKSGVVDDLDWTGTAATAFRNVLGQLTPSFVDAHGALDTGAQVIQRFAAQLETCQRNAAQYSREIDAAQEALDNAKARVAAAEHAVQREIRAAMSNPLHAVSGALNLARIELGEVNVLVDRCSLELREWVTKASANHSVYEDAVRTCTTAINDLMTVAARGIEIRNGDIAIQPIGDGTLSLAPLTTRLFAGMQAWAAANPLQFAPYNARIIANAKAVPIGTDGGSVKGQCLYWVGGIVALAGGPAIAFGNNSLTYQRQWREIATQIATPQGGWSDVRPGDIVQFVGGGNEHTAIITGGNSPSTATVVDSNYGYDHRVSTGSFESRAALFDNSSYIIWRIEK